MGIVGGLSLTRWWALASLVFAALLGVAVHDRLAQWAPPNTYDRRWLRRASIQERDLTSMSPAPSLAAFQQLQANPALLSRNTTFFTAEFEAAPWLLPPRTPALSWAGMHELDELMALRSHPVNGHEKAIAILLFSKPVAEMAQNSIYSLVKFGGVRNYVVVTWTPGDLEACADLNLPCADVSHFLARPVENPGRGADFEEHDWFSIMWIKPPLLVHVLERDYLVLMADVDVAYTAKPVWESYLAFMEHAAAEGAFQDEEPVNGGHFVMLPTASSITFARKWAAMAPSMIGQEKGNQAGLEGMHLHDYFTCSSVCSCFRSRRNLIRLGLRDQLPVFRTFPPSNHHYYQVLFVHAICTDILPVTKESVLRALGFWFVDNEQGCAPQDGSASGVPACRPLQWRLPRTEAPFYACPNPGSLGLVHGAEPAAAAALRAGVSTEEEARLLGNPSNDIDDELPDWC